MLVLGGSVKDKKLNVKRLPNLSNCSFFKCIKKRAKYHPNSVKMAIFFKRSTEIAQRRGFTPRPPAVKRRQILAFAQALPP